MEKLINYFCNSIFGRHRSNTLPRIWILVADMVIVILAYVIAIFMLYFHNFKDALFDVSRFGIVPIVYLIIFLISRTYDGMLRYSGFKDIQKLFLACTFAVVFLIISKYVVAKTLKTLLFIYPRYTTIVYHYLITLASMVIMRFTIRRLYNEVYKRPSDKYNTLIYGAGDGGTMLARTLSQDTESIFCVKAFVDDDPKRCGRQINTIPVFSPKEVMTPEFIEKYGIQVMILAIPSISEQRKKEIIDQGMALNLTVKFIPSFNKWIDGKVSSNQIEDIRIEDILGHKTDIYGKSSVISAINDKVVLVTGAVGSVGSEICRQMMYYNPSKLILLDQAESPMYDIQFDMYHLPNLEKIQDKVEFVICDVKNTMQMRKVFETYHPQVVFHTAGYTHVPFMENNVYEAVSLNVFGTKLLADLAIEYGTEKFVFISSNKAVNPTNIIGVTKRISEMYTQSRNGNTKFITIRLGNVLGSNGSVVQVFRKQIANGGPITVTDRRMTRHFITPIEASSLVLEASSIGGNGDIFVFNTGTEIRIWEMAEKMIKLSHRHDVEIIEIGLRPGEKLYDEVLADNENTIKTDNERILHAVVKKHDAAEMDEMMEKLRAELETYDKMKIVAQMKAIVPEFKSNNNAFSQLDK